MMTQINHRVAVHIRGDQRLQFFNGLRIGEVVELNRVLLRIEVADRLGARARLKDKMIIAGSANRYCLVGSSVGRRIGTEGVRGC